MTVAANPPRRPSTRSEFAAGWPVVLGADIGIAIGAAMTPMLAISVFMNSFEKEFGWSRTEISLGSTIILAVLALTSPFIGWLADRVRSVWIATFGLTGLSASYVALGSLGPDLRFFYLACAGTAVIACGAGTTTFARAVSECFVRQRGLALGIAMVGTGVTAILMPAVLAPYAAQHGWRAGYRLLALVVACGTPLVALLMSRAPRPACGSVGTEAGSGGKAILAAALGGRVFWTLAVCFVVIPLSLAGMLVHLLAFLHDAGVDPASAGMIAGSAGLTQIVCRVLSGWLIDRFFAPGIATVMMVTSAVGLGLVAVFGAPLVLLAPLAFGIALGAEIDLLGFLTARYFGMLAYGRIYGLLYAATMLGSAVSPIFYGVSFDLTGSYRAALFLGSALLLLSGALFATLPPFPEDAA